MKKFMVLVGGIVILSAFSLRYHFMDANNNGGRPFTVVLSAENELPPCISELDATGTFEMRLNVGQGTITYAFDLQNIGNIRAAHIHRGTAIVNGPVVVPLLISADGDGSGEIDIDKALAQEINKNPEAFYVNVHTAACPGGAIRGQLSK